MVVEGKGKIVRRVVARSIPFLLITLFVSCSEWPEPIAYSGESEKIHVLRVDSILFNTPKEEMAATCLMLQAEAGDFFQAYVERIMRIAPIEDPNLASKLYGFTQHPDWKKAQQDVEKSLGDMAHQKQVFSAAFSRLKVVFPEAVVPQVVVYNSGFNDGIFFGDSLLGIGAEWFMGTDNELIQRLDPATYPNYMKARMNPEMMVPYSMKGWLVGHYAEDVRGKDALAHMVALGKVMVLMDLVMPETPDTLKLSFTQAQLEWCEEQEFNIWRELVDNELLYSKSQEDIGRLMNDAPFTNGFPRESPGHIGEWIGKRMVEHYWEANKNLTLQEVLDTKDPRQILKYYKP